jgi:hypothetical protein
MRTRRVVWEAAHELARLNDSFIGTKVCLVFLIMGRIQADVCDVKSAALHADFLRCRFLNHVLLQRAIETEFCRVSRIVVQFD